MARYINPYTDFGFKKLFGEEANKDLLVDFLNQLLPPHHQIAELNFKNTEQLPEYKDGRKAFFDIHCKSGSGEHFVVEMQKAKVKHFKDRSLFYITFPIREQAPKQKDWDFYLSPIYMVAILDFPYSEEEERQKLLRDVSLKDQDCEVFYDKLNFKFIEMPAFKKEAHELETRFDKWLYFLKGLATFDDIPAILREPIFERAFQTAELANMPPAQQKEYESSRMAYLEVKAVSDTAEEKGYNKARAESQAEVDMAKAEADMAKAEADMAKAEADMAKAEADMAKAEAQTEHERAEAEHERAEALARQKAEAEARADALERAKTEAETKAREAEIKAKTLLYETARAMKQSGLPTDVIQNITGLTEGEIAAL